MRPLAEVVGLSSSAPRKAASVAAWDPTTLGSSLEALVARAKDGDTIAATELLRSLSPHASRIVRRLAGPTSAQDDLVQESLLGLLHSLPKFEGRSSVTTFLFGICVRVVREHRRSSARILRTLEKFFFFGSWHTDAPGPDEPGVLRDRSRAIQRLLARLPQRRREVLVLFEMEGRTAAEVAEILGIPEATVYTRLYHARRAFRRLAERAPELRKDSDG